MPSNIGKNSGDQLLKKSQPDLERLADVARRYGVSRTTLYKHVGVIMRRQS
jgi:transposase-like protein